MLRNLGLRTKLLGLVALPMVVLLVLSAVIVANARSAANSSSDVRRLAEASVRVTSLVHALQDERSSAYASVGRGGAVAPDELRRQRSRTNSLLADVRAALPESLTNRSAALAEAAARTISLAGGVTGQRAELDESSLSVDDVAEYFTQTIAVALTFPKVVADINDDPAVASRLRAYADVAHAIEAAALERDLVARAFRTNRIDGATFRRVGALAGAQSAELKAFYDDAPPEQANQLRAALRPELEQAVIDQRAGIDRVLLNQQRADARTWSRAADERITPLVAAEGAGARAVVDGAQAAADTSSRQALAVGLATLLAVLLAGGLALLMARRLVNPLRRLTTAAGDISEALPRMVATMQTPGAGPEVELPDIPVTTKDEIGQLAKAFNEVNAVTVQVAHEQAALRASIAEMFVNVARRNQVLLGRQLAFIEQLEAREEDPDTLANLFRLDHLATRMRRNAESLLVLAGIDANRRLRSPMSLTDVVRTAASEIESYDRVDLAAAADPPVQGRFALTAAHVLAELLENATHFSDPSTRVTVTTGFAADGVEITITDLGLGMSEAEISDANHRISDPPATEIAVAQRLGFYVVGRLAQRLGATVRLHAGRNAGTVVVILLPSPLFEAGSVPVAAPQADPAPEPVAARPSAATALDVADSAKGVEVFDSPLAEAAAAPGRLPRAARPTRRLGLPRTGRRRARRSAEPEVVQPVPAVGPAGEPSTPELVREPAAEPAAAVAPAAVAPAVPAAAVAPAVPAVAPAAPAALSAPEDSAPAAATAASAFGAAAVDILPVRSGKPGRPARLGLPARALGRARSAEPAPPVDQPVPAERSPIGDLLAPQPALLPVQEPSADLFAPASPAVAAPAGPPLQAPAAPPAEATVPSPRQVAQPLPEDDPDAIGAYLASSALNELTRLSASSPYSPQGEVTAAAPQAPTARPLTRRTPKPDAAPPPAASSAPPKERSAEEVRGMLSGFRAGVERGRDTAGVAAESSTAQSSTAQTADSIPSEGPIQ